MPCADCTAVQAADWTAVHQCTDANKGISAVHQCTATQQTCHNYNGSMWCAELQAQAQADAFTIGQLKSGRLDSKNKIQELEVGGHEGGYKANW